MDEEIFYQNSLVAEKIYASYTWSIPAKEPTVYFTFDDGPHPVATPFVLDTLRQYEARASFFCIGKNVAAHPDLYRRILEEGHSVGNHTQHHLNGWKTKDAVYLDDVKQATAFIDSGLFRPPYGRISSFQARNIQKAMNNDAAKVIMWDVLSADFDTTLSGEDCLQHVVLNAVNGSIIVFHDSEKAFRRLEYCLPKALDFFKKKGIKLEKL